MATELRCPRHLHAIAAGEVVEVRCRWCGGAYHRWLVTAAGAVYLDGGEHGEAQAEAAEEAAAGERGQPAAGGRGRRLSEAGRWK